MKTKDFFQGRLYTYKTADEIKAKIPEAIQWLRDQHCGCWYWYLGKIRDYDYAITLGWAYIGDIEEPDDYYEDGYRIAIKIGRQPYNSGMQCDIDTDWEMPLLSEDGEVWDTEEYLYEADDTNSTVDFLFKVWDKMKPFYEKHGL